MNLRVKIALFIIVSAIFFSGILIMVISTYLNRTLTESLIEQGKIVGTNISEMAAEKLIEDDMVALRRNIEKYRRYSNIEYIIIEDFDRNIKADTYNGQVPPELIGANKITAGEGSESHIELITVREQGKENDIFDILVPVKEGLLGFSRVGMKKSYVDQRVNETVLFVGMVIGAGILFSLIIALFVVTIQITRPVIYLTKAAEEVSLGNFDKTIEINVNNELQSLAAAIDRMRESLRTSIERMNARSLNRL